MTKKTILFCLILVSSLVSIAQPPKKFQNKYGGSGYDVGYDVKQTLDNGYIITGSTSSFGQGNTDVYLLKIDSMGRKKFETSFGGYSNESGKSIVQLSDSSFVITGFTSSIGIGGYDIYLVKADKNGNLLWQKTIGGSDWDFANSIQVTPDGGFIIGGTTYSFGYGNADGYIVKTDALGNVIWTKTYGGTKDDEFKSVINTIDNKYALTGYTKSYGDSLGNAWVFKIDSNGDSLWCTSIGGKREDFGNEIAQDNLGDYYIAGSRDSLSPGKLDAYAFKVNNAGAFVWHFVDGLVSANETYNSVVVSQIKQGFSVYTETEYFAGFGIHVKIFEMNSGGFWNNATEYGANLADEILKISSTKDKGYVGVGYTNNYGALLTDVYFLKLDTTLLGSVSIVSVDEQKEISAMEIFPNPVFNILTIKSGNPINHKLFKLYDIYGNEINIFDRTESFDIYSSQIDCSSLASGIYFLNYKTLVKKIIIEK